MKYKRKSKSTSGKSANTQRVTIISRHAKRTRKAGEAWTKAIQRATKELKKEGKL
ncbi:hypothetical protein GCM10011506_29920 [Marivirga lumbricoides]|uniref:Uncharacterized protein n=1 Tax=Marivirga lumbricoides TaxID=1046115 RepID=A0ABQ1MLH1_9BACT|nr:hypothetical protein GCM10011506_29920 [Marivirga lumbricoides]